MRDEAVSGPGRTLMALLAPRNLLVPVLLFSAFATSIPELRSTFWLTGRWFVAGALAIYGLTVHRGITGATGTFLALGAYLAWCFATAAWSDVPDLTTAKALALVMVCVAGLWGGHLWTQTHDDAHMLDFLWPSVVVALAAGRSSGVSDSGAGDFTLLAGATNNPNVLGTFVPLCVPVVLWRLFHTHRRGTRLWLGAILTIMLVILYLTVSRGGYLILICTMAGLLAAFEVRRLILAVAAVLLAVLYTVTFAPDAVDAWVLRNVYKASDTERGVLFRREQVWEESYTAALEGGWIGLGLGVSAGSESGMLGSSVTTIGYTREKGNSQLAIVEETGLAGLAFYAMFVVTLFVTLLRGFSSATGNRRLQLGILIGALTGLIAQSALEAWWVGPGSPESLFFWVFAGAALGLAEHARHPRLHTQVIPPLA